MTNRPSCIPPGPSRNLLHHREQCMLHSAQMGIRSLSIIMPCKARHVGMVAGGQLLGGSADASFSVGGIRLEAPL